MRTASPRHVRPAPRRRTWLWSEAAVVAVAFALFVAGPSLRAPLPTDTQQQQQATVPASDQSVTSAPEDDAAPSFTGSTTSSFINQVGEGRKLLGVAPHGIKTSLASLNTFAQLIGRQPNVVEFYQGFTESFDAPVAAGASRTGALPLDSWGPAGASLADVASGRDDAYLTMFAGQVRDYGKEIALTVGHEMNAPWSDWWGNGPADAPTFVQAWRHIHDLFAQQGATNVIWVWTVNIEAGGAASPVPYYPGDGYVDWIGVDGYFHDGLPGTFPSLFGPTLSDLRAHYRLPILVVETGALDYAAERPAEIQSVFDATLASPDLIGFIWFDYDLQGTEGVDWQLDDDQPSLAVYRRDATASPFALPAPVNADIAPFYPGSTS